jgi:hypothetical protein
MPAPSNQLFNLTEWPALDEENIHIKNANYDLFCSPGLVGNADSDETYNTPSPSSVRSIDPTGEFNMATELPARPPVEGSVPIRTITAMQPTIEDEDKDVDEGCESALLQRADPSLLERRHSLQSKEPAYLPTPPSDSPTPPLPHKSHHVSSQLFRVTKPRSKEKSVKKRNSIPMKKSAIQTNPMSNKQASQSNDIDMPTTQAVVNPQQPEYPEWVREDIAYDLMWSQFVADPKVEMSEVALRDALDLVNHVHRYDAPSFLEKQSFLWHNNDFWCHTPLHLAVTRDFSTEETCLAELCYIDDLQTEMGANKVRERMAMIRLCGSFKKLCSEMKAHSAKRDFLPQEGKRPRLESIAINKLLQLKHTGKRVDSGVKDRDRSNLSTSKFRGSRWYQLAYYIGWGVLLLCDDHFHSQMYATFYLCAMKISANISGRGKINGIQFKALITYIVNARPDIVALCREYEKPALDLLSGGEFTHNFTDEGVSKTIDRLTQANSEFQCSPQHWKPIDFEIEMKRPEAIQLST